MKTAEEMIQEATDRGFLTAELSEDKTLADRLVREGKLIAVARGGSGIKHYRLAPPPKAKKKVKCGICGVTFLSWTAGACGKCKSKR